MSPRRLVAVPAPPGAAGAAAFREALAEALAGGPAVLPVPENAPYDVREAFGAGLPLERDDIAAVVPTSGSTGSPKGVLLTAEALRAAAFATAEALGGPGRWLVALPLSSIAGLMQLVRSLTDGMPPAPMSAAPFTARAFAEATAELGDGRRYTSLVPAQLTRLARDAAGLEALATYDAVLVGGAAADARVLAEVRAAGVRLVTTYGMTETCGGCVYDGTPLPGTRADIGADDRIRLRGPSLFAGYRLSPDLTSEAIVDGWYLTQDRGRWTPDGRLEVLGRLDDVVISGGVNVDLAAVEAALSDVPGLAEVAVVAVPDPEWGARVTAVACAAHPGDEAGLPSAVRTRVRDRLGAPAAPRAVVLVAALPRLPSGKVDRTACARLAREAETGAA